LTEPILLFGVSFDFVLFALTLFGIALFHRHTLVIALAGLAAITAYKLTFTGFNEGTGLVGLGFHLSHEFSLLSNLFLLLTGFALLSRHFEENAIPDESRVAQCLVQNKQQLSPACTSVFNRPRGASVDRQQPARAQTTNY